MGAEKVAAWMVCLGVIGIALGGCPPETTYEVVFDQGNFGKDADVSVLTSDPPPGGTQAADMLTLASGLTTIARLEWWGTQNPAITRPDNFVMRIFESTAGLPNARPLYAIPVGDVDRVDTGHTTSTAIGGTPVYRYSVDLSPFDLDPGYGYFISILNKAGHDWMWMCTDGTGASTVTCSRVSDGGIWNPSYDHDLAFRLWR
jgi:hypothetical protein